MLTNKRIYTTSYGFKDILKPIVKKILDNLESKTRDQKLLASGNFISYAKAFWRTKFKYHGRCVVCGTKDNVQMHHIRKIGGYDKQTSQQDFGRIMSLLNRKQIPVCKFHHLRFCFSKTDLIHKGLYLLGNK